jgi:hypothetical protein
MNVDVRCRGDAAPKDGIRFRGMKSQGCDEAGTRYATQQETAQCIPGKMLLPDAADAMRTRGLSQGTEISVWM